MTPQTARRATLDDLHGVEGNAELIDGVIVPMSPVGKRPNIVTFNIAFAMRVYAQSVGKGVTFIDSIGFRVPALKSGRESFGPDVAYHLGAMPANEDAFIPGAPTLAVEVRSENDYGSKPDRLIALKRADYFEAGTLSVWDVNPRARTVTIYPAATPDAPLVFGESDVVEVEAIMPGFRLPVVEVFAGVGR